MNTLTVASEEGVVDGLDCGGRLVDTTVVRVPCAVQGRAVVVNLGPSPILVREQPPSTLAPYSSTVLVDTELIEVGTALLLRPAAHADLARIVEQPGWGLLGDLLPATPDGPAFPRDVPLWRGPQDEVGICVLDPGRVLGNGSPTGVSSSFAISVNLWFAPAGTNCVIHNLHDFIEIHTQIHGYGRMQKFRSPDPATLYEDVEMSPGTTHAPFGSTTDADGFSYPWHQYRADTDCIWLAVEYHRTDGSGPQNGGR